jgi:ClpP class serine protease
MIKLFYAMQEELLKRYAETKNDIIQARNKMDEKSIQIAKNEIITECQIHDFDPEDTGNLYTVENGVANIPIEGMLVQKVDICAAFFGETVTTYSFIREAVDKAEKDPLVKSVQFNINSGGGVVSGVDETAQKIRTTGKESVAVVRDMAASAAYWLASAADKIRISSNAAFLGSIGVAAEVVNRDKADEMKGVKRVVLTNATSKDKRPNLMSEDGQQVLVDELDAIYDVFAESILVKRSDKLTREKIDSLGGKVVIASKAIELGLADGMITDEENIGKSARANPGVNIKEEEFNMELSEFLSKNPEAKAEYDKAVAKGSSDAVAEDRARGKDIFTLYGVNDASIKAYMDGKSVETLAVEEKRRAVEAQKKAANAPGNTIGAMNTDSQEPKIQNDAQAKQTSAEKKMDAAVDELVKKTMGGK